MRIDPRHDAWMRIALEQARSALPSDDVPVGAVVVAPSGEVVAAGFNERELGGDPTAHAEIVAMRRAAAAHGGWNLSDHTLVVTLEPCAMCAGAILAARIGTVVFGAWDEKAGAAGSVYDLLRDRRLPQRADVVTGVLEESESLLRAFFATRRD
jgi:tRNA(adenine34) deaminase